MTTPDTPIPDEAVRLAAEAIEDEAIRHIGRDLGTIHRDDIVRAGLTAAAPILRKHWAQQDRVHAGADVGTLRGVAAAAAPITLHINPAQDTSPAAYAAGVRDGIEIARRRGGGGGMRA